MTRNSTNASVHHERMADHVKKRGSSAKGYNVSGSIWCCSYDEMISFEVARK
jgi:hypothetical protein